MLNLYHVRYWLDAAALGSLAAAARHNHVSQSAVGQAVRALEQSLGLNLTTHERHAFALTEAGRTLLEPCAQLLAVAERVVALGETLQEGVRGPLDIGMTHTVAASLFSPVAGQLRAEYPQVALSLALGNSQVIRGWLADGTVHLGLYVDDDATAAVERYVVRRGSYVLFVRRGTRPAVAESGLIVTRRDRPEVRAMVRGLSEHLGRPVPIRYEIVSWEVIKSYVLADAGCGLCPDYMLDSPGAREVLEIVPLPFD
ncbi:MAG TPA: LysR family transcriptional regulator, partial [Myxococcota bacterium]|nr:LysR family transcriptional regulator [Myxococcota bacterium]